jgi:transposase-like protein
MHSSSGTTLVALTLDGKQRKEAAADLKKIYQAATEQEAEMELEAFAQKWDAKFPTISQTWRRNWTRMIPFFAHPIGRAQNNLHHQCYSNR